MTYNLTAQLHRQRAREIDQEIDAMADRILAHPERYGFHEANAALDAHARRAEAHRLAAAHVTLDAHFDALEEIVIDGGV